MTTSLRRSGARSHSLLASASLALLLGASLAGCGGSDSDTATDPESSSEPSVTTPAETPTETPTDAPPEPPAPSEEGPATGEALEVTGDAGITGATLISATDAGGTASTLAMVLDTEQAQTDFTDQFKSGFGESVLVALDKQKSMANTTPYGVVAAIGCDAPESVQIEAGEAGFEVTPSMPKETVQCFAPVTFVVLFAAPTS